MTKKMIGQGLYNKIEGAVNKVIPPKAAPIRSAAASVAPKVKATATAPFAGVLTARRTLMDTLGGKPPKK